MLMRLPANGKDWRHEDPALTRLQDTFAVCSSLHPHVGNTQSLHLHNTRSMQVKADPILMLFRSAASSYVG